MLDTNITYDDEQGMCNIITLMRGRGINTYSSNIANFTQINIYRIEAIVGKLAYDRKVRMVRTGWRLV